MSSKYQFRRVITAFLAVMIVSAWLMLNPNSYDTIFTNPATNATDYNAIAITEYDPNAPLATEILHKLEIKGRAPKTGYAREKFYTEWPLINGCSLRQHIIKREFGEHFTLNKDNCNITSGEYDEPYTGEHKTYPTRADINNNIQIDHVVALSDAWQKGAQNLSAAERYEFATDPLNLLAVDSTANQNKSDSDAATWLPSNKSFRCQYVARQVSVKYKYHLWVTQAEYDTIEKILEHCPSEPAIGISL